MTRLSVTVIGTPVGQGSVSFFGRGRAVSTNAATLHPWRHAIAAEIRDALDDYPSHSDDDPLFGTDYHPGGLNPRPMPVAVTAHFYLPRLASQPKRAAWWPVRKHDLDRLVRACLDAVTASGTWIDDGQVCRLVASKEYAAPGTLPRLELEIREMTE